MPSAEIASDVCAFWATARGVCLLPSDINLQCEVAEIHSAGDASRQASRRSRSRRARVAACRLLPARA